MNNERLQFALTAFGLRFVMINPIAVSPVLVAVTSGMDAHQRKATLTRAIILLLAAQAGSDWARLGVPTGVLAFIYLIAWPIMFMAERVMNWLGDGPLHIITRILGLVLAALAVQFILNGIAAFYHGLIGA